jgi:hypothetical protein
MSTNSEERPSYKEAHDLLKRAKEEADSALRDLTELHAWGLRERVRYFMLRGLGCSPSSM